MIEALLGGALTIVTDPIAILIFIAALLGGLTFGAIPGLSGVALCALLLPFSMYLPPAYAIMMFAVIYCSATYGGAVTGILFNIPGDANNAPTMLDGYPLTMQGKSGQAIGMAVTCSALGGTLSALLMIVATEPIAHWAVRAFGPPEIFALVIMGLSISGTLGGSSVWKGWLSVCLGLLVATIGVSPGDVVERFTFGFSSLQGGIDFVPVLLGVFAVSEVLTQGHQMVAGTRIPPKIGVKFPSFFEFWRMRIAIVRSVVIGFFAGLLPGIGATLAAFLSYSQAVRWSRHPERFGKGEIEGVASTETANNAATGAAMIPLLAIGIPGGGITAIILASFQLHGIQVGPGLMLANTELVYIVFVAMLLANISILFLGYFETKTIVHLLRIPFGLLGPIILTMATIGVFALKNAFIDVWVMLVAGILAFFLRRMGYSMPGIVLGLILGQIGEAAFVKAMPILRYDLTGFLDRPTAMVLFALAGISLAFPLWRGAALLIDAARVRLKRASRKIPVIDTESREQR